MKRCIAFFIAVILLTGALTPPIARADAGEKALTLMVYMCGSNLESGSGAATTDLMEMANSGYDVKSVNLIVMTGGTTQWSLGLPTDALSIYQPGRGQLRMLYAFEDMSMGDPDALTALLDYGFERCPAKSYALILWDHGGGPLNGVCWDERYDGDSLTMAELCQALGQSPAARQKLSWIGFDACLMASAEVGHLISPYAEYMIASQETEPGTGWDYSFLQGIEGDADGAATGRRVVDSYFDHAGDAAGLTLSLTDLSALADLSIAADTLFSDMEITGGNYARYSYAARQTRAYGKAAVEGTGYDLFDLGSLIRQLASSDPDAAAEAEDALSRAVVYSRSGDGQSGGLSVYHPYENKSDYVGGWSDLYPQVGFSEGYDAYVERFAAYLFGQQAVSWSGLQALPTNDAGIIALPLSESQLSMTASALVDLLRWDGARQAYAPAGSVTSLDVRDGVLYARLPGAALRAFGADGNAAGDPIPYTLTDENRLGVYVNFCAEGAERTPEALRTVPVNTSGERKSRTITFGTETSSGSQQQGTVSTSGSATADTLDAQAVSLNDAFAGQTAGTLSLTAPENASALEAVSVPADLTAAFGTVSVSTDMTGSGLSLSPEDQFCDITPVPQSNRANGSVSYEGSPVPLDSFVSIDIQTFDPSVTLIDLSGHRPEQPPQAVERSVVHAWIDWAVTDDGQTADPRIWIYDEERDLWTRGDYPDNVLYPVSVFPVSWLQPMADTDGGLYGIDAWTPAGDDDAALIGGAWSLRFAPWEGEPLCAAFHLTDTQNRRHESAPVMIKSIP